MRLVAALLLSIPLATPAPAQDGHHGLGHAEMHDWYRTLRHPFTGRLCCDNRDCRPTRAYVDDEGYWRAMLDGHWVLVPDDVVLKNASPDGRSHICANERGVIFCFVGGVPKG
ncbi:MAG: hypothetical protein KF889_13470 [Alphaproteobacteria bacterium]|nr:hypothetical protein [Alphaproteobacteria bacterium]MCW5738993.1 hypothetical protein [Alphaproteobacteria bacterium]